MDISNLPLINGLSRRMNFLSQRSSVIAQNIANADSPGYLAKDLKAPTSFGAHLANTAQLRTSSTKHLSTGQSGPNSATTINAGTTSPDLTGNTVSLETETMKMSQTRMDYGLAASVYRKSLNMIRIAIRADR